jgi:hypothetical protein
MALKTEDLGKIEREFPEFYFELFESSVNRFKQTMKIKNHLIE